MKEPDDRAFELYLLAMELIGILESINVRVTDEERRNRMTAATEKMKERANKILDG